MTTNPYATRSATAATSDTRRAHAARARMAARLERAIARDDARDVAAAIVHFCNARRVARGRT